MALPWYMEIDATRTPARHWACRDFAGILESAGPCGEDLIRREDLRYSSARRLVEDFEACVA